MGKIITSVIATLMLLAMCGCNLEKIIASKDDKAVERVTAKKSLLNRVKPAIDSIYPCIVDTLPKYIKGKTDSVNLVVLIPSFIDTVNRKRIVDSLSKLNAMCKENLQVAYDKGFDAGIDFYKGIKIPSKATDTLINTLVNRRELDICNAARIDAINKSAAQESAKNIYKDDRKVCFFIIIGLIILLIISNVLWLKLKVL